MKSKITTFIAGALLFTYSAISQDQDFNQLNFSSPLKYNPALTGLQNDTELNLRATRAYKYNSVYSDFSQYSKKVHGAVGFYYNKGRMEQGKSDFYSGGVTYAYQNKLSDKWNYSIGDH
jgi:hypothetical protein